LWTIYEKVIIKHHGVCFILDKTNLAWTLKAFKELLIHTKSSPYRKKWAPKIGGIFVIDNSSQHILKLICFNVDSERSERSHNQQNHEHRFESENMYQLRPCFRRTKSDETLKTLIKVAAEQKTPATGRDCGAASNLQLGTFRPLLEQQGLVGPQLMLMLHVPTALQASSYLNGLAFLFDLAQKVLLESFD
jgi:hypothetical protein